MGAGDGLGVLKVDGHPEQERTEPGAVRDRCRGLGPEPFHERALSQDGLLVGLVRQRCLGVTAGVGGGPESIDPQPVDDHLH